MLYSLYTFLKRDHNKNNLYFRFNTKFFKATYIKYLSFFESDKKFKKISLNFRVNTSLVFWTAFPLIICNVLILW